MAVNLWDSWVSVLNGKHLSLQSEFDSRSSFLDNITNAPAAYLDPTNHPPTPLDNRSFDKVRSILMYERNIVIPGRGTSSSSFLDAGHRHR